MSKANVCEEVHRGLAKFRAGARAQRLYAEGQWWRASGQSLQQAIARAAQSVAFGKMHSHQRRLGHAKCLHASRLLVQRTGQFNAARDFDDLYELVRLALVGQKGFGPLYWYDVAHRIGMRLDLPPEFVYLHAGTKCGAKKLGVATAGRSKIAVDELPCGLSSLLPDDAEDFLCHFHSGRFGSDCITDGRVSSSC